VPEHDGWNTVASLQDNVKQAMRTRIRSRWPLFEFMMLLMVGVIGWAAFKSWELVREMEGGQRVDRRRQQLQQVARQRNELTRLLELYAVRDDYLAFEKHAQPALQEMRETLRRYGQSSDAKDWRSFEWSRRTVNSWMERLEQRLRGRNLTELNAWMDRRLVEEDAVSDRPSTDVGELLRKFRELSSEYAASAEFIHQTLNAPVQKTPTAVLPRRVDAPPPRDPDAQRRREVVDERLEIAEAQSLKLLDLVDSARREGTSMCNGSSRLERSRSRCRSTAPNLCRICRHGSCRFYIRCRRVWWVCAFFPAWPCIAALWWRRCT
jgi:hypothetical protein